jgi:hypothetical protein
MANCRVGRGGTAKRGVKRGQALIPEVRVVLEPCLGGSQWRWFEAADVRASLHRTPDQATALQCFHMLRGSRQRHAKGCSQLTYCVLTAGQSPQHLAARGIGQRMEDRIKPFWFQPFWFD